jgi:hypothetical protein
MQVAIIFLGTGYFMEWSGLIWLSQDESRS